MSALFVVGCTADTDATLRDGEAPGMDDEGDESCARTQGYWKNHLDQWPIADPSLCGQTWDDILHTPPKGGDAWYILAHQWIATSLNAANGTFIPADIAAALTDAEGLLAACEISDADRASALALASALDEYNNGDHPEGSCPSGECVNVFFDDFEAGVGQWTLESLWSQFLQDSNVLRGFWTNFAVGCGVTSAAAMAVDVDLSSSTTAELSYMQQGSVCAFDTIRVLVSTDGGAIWTDVGPIDLPTPGVWTSHTVDLSPYVGNSTVRVSFEFENVCGDPCGVDWRIDDVGICAD